MWTPDWDLTATTSDVVAQYKDFHPTILSIIRKATSIKRWPLLYREPMPRWAKGRLVLVGDAAHPMLPRKSGYLHHDRTARLTDSQIKGKEVLRRSRMRALSIPSSMVSLARLPIRTYLTVLKYLKQFVSIGHLQYRFSPMPDRTRQREFTSARNLLWPQGSIFQQHLLNT